MRQDQRLRGEGRIWPPLEKAKSRLGGQEGESGAGGAGSGRELGVPDAQVRSLQSALT